MTFREATVADVDALRAVARRSWERDPALTRETATASVEEWYDERHLGGAIRAPDEVVLVATDEMTDDTAESTTDEEPSGTGAEVVAFSHSVVDLPSGTVLRLYVDPEHRRAGVGSALLEATCEALASRGIESVQAFVLTANDPGNEFYRSSGFERVDEGQTVIGGESYAEAVFERPVR